MVKKNETLALTKLFVGWMDDMLRRSDGESTEPVVDVWLSFLWAEQLYREKWPLRKACESVGGSTSGADEIG